jgi:dipeptidase E
MRLYLSSYRLGNAVETLLRLIGGGRRVAIVANALDLIPDQQRAHFRQTTYDPVVEFARLGLQAEMLDLRDYFGGKGLDATLSRCDLVWILGGNSFVLRRAMAQSGFDRAIATALAGDELVYGGFSAGAVVATPTLRGIEVMDDPQPVPVSYARDIVWDGLGLVDFSIVPHVDSDHPETELAAVALGRMAKLALVHRPLRDGEVIVREGDAIRLLGTREEIRS